MYEVKIRNADGSILAYKDDKVFCIRECKND